MAIEEKMGDEDYISIRAALYEQTQIDVFLRKHMTQNFLQYKVLCVVTSAVFSQAKLAIKLCIYF